MFYHVVCDPYDVPQDSCMFPSDNAINNLVELKCQENCTVPCQTTYLRCNHTSRLFETVEFSPCGPGNTLHAKLWLWSSP